MSAEAAISHSPDWPVARLRDLAIKIGSGATPTGGAETYLLRRQIFALVRSQNVFDRYFSKDGLAFISNAQAGCLKGASLRPNDVLLNITGDGITFSRACRVPADILPACVNQHVAIIRAVPDRLDAGYLLAFLTHPTVKSYIEGFNAGGSRRAITKAHIESFRIPLPPLRQQREIGAVLDALDDKIDLNRRMNATLEAMARAIFKDWFVDFGPTRAKMQGRAPYLAPEIWSLFPDRLDDEGKPEGWRMAPLDQIAEFLNGLALQKYPGVDETDLPVIKIAELRAGNAAGTDRASSAIRDQYIVENGDVLFSWSGSLIQRVWTGGRGALNQHLFKVTSTSWPKWLHYFWVDHHLPNFQAIAASKATTMGHIQRHHLSEAETVLGCDDIMNAADQIIAPLFQRGIANDMESRSLATTRDLLLPKLMSGELRVRDAERMVEAVV